VTTGRYGGPAVGNWGGADPVLDWLCGSGTAASAARPTVAAPISALAPVRKLRREVIGSSAIGASVRLRVPAPGVTTGSPSATPSTGGPIRVERRFASASQKSAVPRSPAERSRPGRAHRPAVRRRRSACRCRATGSPLRSSCAAARPRRGNAWPDRRSCDRRVALAQCECASASTTAVRLSAARYHRLGIRPPGIAEVKQWQAHLESVSFRVSSPDSLLLAAPSSNALTVLVTRVSPRERA